jgi:FdhD protein
VKRSIVTMAVFRAGAVFCAGSSAGSDKDLVAVEEPLQIRLRNRDLAVIMRTPGNDDELAAGFLFTEGVLHAREDVAEIRCDDNSVTVSMTRVADEYLTAHQRPQQRNPYLTSSCGVGGEASVDLLGACPRQLPTDHVPAVPTRAYQSDQSSR